MSQTFREFYSSLRRRIDASARPDNPDPTKRPENPYSYEHPKNQPRPILDRVTCHPGQERIVERIIFEVNPWTGEVESHESVPKGIVRAIWRTGGRVEKTGDFVL